MTDLKERGLLDETLVVWGGEFGRTAYSQGGLNSGRDHHGRCFSMWMAGGGDQSPASNTARQTTSATILPPDGVHIRDLNATILHSLGIDHNRLTFKIPGSTAKSNWRGAGTGRERDLGIAGWLANCFSIIIWADVHEQQ